MRRTGHWAARAAVLGIGVMLGGCTWFENSTVKVADGITGAGQRVRAPWGGMRPGAPEQSTTVARLRGEPTDVAPLQTESGDVWPVPEAPRATLANPDAALKGIPSYNPGDLERASRQPNRVQADDPLPPGLQGSSSAPPPPIRQPGFPPPYSAPSAADNSPPPRRADGRTLMTPQGPVTTTGGTDRLQTYTTPGGGVGTARTDGNFTTFTGPTGQVQTLPNPR